MAQDWKQTATGLEIAALAIIAILAFIPTRVSAQNASAGQVQGSAPVSVVNTPTVNVGNTPLPVTGTISGTVTIGNTPNVNVANQPTVSVAGQPIGVNVTNSPLMQLPTHLGVPAANVVNLTTKLGQTCMPLGSLCQVTSDGKFVATPFTIPAGHFLVITDIQIRTVGATPGTLSGADLVIGQPGNQQIIYVVQGLADANGQAFVRDHLTGGLVVSTMPTVSPFEGASIVGYLVP